MAKIELNGSQIDGTVLPALRSATVTIRQIEHQYQSMVIPHDFGDRALLQANADRIHQARGKLEQLDQQISTTNQVFDRILSQMEQQVRMINHVTIARREKQVK